MEVEDKKFCVVGMEKEIPWRVQYTVTMSIGNLYEEI